MMEFVLVPTSGTYTRRLSDRVVASFGIFSPRTQFLILPKSAEAVGSVATGNGLERRHQQHRFRT